MAYCETLCVSLQLRNCELMQHSETMRLLRAAGDSETSSEVGEKVTEGLLYESVGGMFGEKDCESATSSDTAALLLRDYDTLTGIPRNHLRRDYDVRTKLHRAHRQE